MNHLQEVLHAVYMIQVCRTATAATYPGYHPMDAMVGEMDWAGELARLLEGVVVSANYKQVGGSHYQGGIYQHWDFCIENNLGYLEGQITKYLSRWRQKAGRQDLEKAAHYADKLVECADRRLKFKLRRLFGTQALPDFTCQGLLTMIQAYSLTSDEQEVFLLVCEYRTHNALERIQQLLQAKLKKENQ